MSVYQVDSEQLTSASANVAVSAEAIRSSVAAMMAQLHALEGSWVGGASASFQALITRWHATQQQVEESLDALSSALASASATYVEAESGVASMFAG